MGVTKRPFLLHNYKQEREGGKGKWNRATARAQKDSLALQPMQLLRKEQLLSQYGTKKGWGKTNKQRPLEGIFSLGVPKKYQKNINLNVMFRRRELFSGLKMRNKLFFQRKPRGRCLQKPFSLL